MLAVASLSSQYTRFDCINMGKNFWCRTKRIISIIVLLFNHIQFFYFFGPKQKAISIISNWFLFNKLKLKHTKTTNNKKSPESTQNSIHKFGARLLSSARHWTQYLLHFLNGRLHTVTLVRMELGANGLIFEFQVFIWLLFDCFRCCCWGSLTSMNAGWHKHSIISFFSI